MAPKKSMRTKGKTVALGEFLQTTPGIIPIQPIRPSPLSQPLEEDLTELKSRLIHLPSAPRASRDLAIPKKAPYIANLSNLPYDADVETVAKLFKNMNVYKMNIPQLNGKLRGYGQVEFEDYESLVGAVMLPEPAILGRKVKIEVGTEKRDYEEMGRKRREENENSWRNNNGNNVEKSNLVDGQNWRDRCFNGNGKTVRF